MLENDPELLYRAIYNDQPFEPVGGCERTVFGGPRKFLALKANGEDSEEECGCPWGAGEG